jgi:hypothetical protein
MIVEYCSLPPAAATVDAALLFRPVEAVVVWSMRFLLRFTCRLETAFFAEAGFFAFAAEAFFTFAAAVFFPFSVAAFFAFAPWPAFGTAVLPDAAMKPWSARGLSGAPWAAPMAKVITPAATAAVTTVNFCM